MNLSQVHSKVLSKWLIKLLKAGAVLEIMPVRISKYTIVQICLSD